MLKRLVNMIGYRKWKTMKVELPWYQGGAKMQLESKMIFGFPGLISSLGGDLLLREVRIHLEILV
ncbi:hypothetical protein D8674_008464 [Pyrus ussuriensis x Pyrus communis]|uniref:Uncharacterized protein n=1 Tax=Pyrus ussuriensis x Pyrus communis TaxID=2448454 RepID=A0A5N5HSV7_9ROSA|nr:hypothetical protein D8674_008464 [Pyrus ussuriensis x Pyrus communis]